MGTTHQHIYNFRLDMDVDGEGNSLREVNPKVAENTDGGPRKSVMVTEEKVVRTEQEAIQKFDPSTIRLLSNPNKENKVGNPVSYQIIPPPELPTWRAPKSGRSCRPNGCMPC
ncbi:copper amine oxidase [Paenibacillus caseinilyticus]|uniref:copper amine oxidase n=1 Tax=Paenibacillus mucilaginosus TaxID=61624 RepID=UPI000683F97F|nr:hypothetical protein [Paenibacillus mucilaginosus]